MGSRLGVLIKSESGWDLRYSHWAAQTIGLDIAIDGIENTLIRVAAMSPLGIDTPDQWYGAVHVEGGLVIDHTTKTITWAEETDWEYLPRYVNTLVEHTWPGETVLEITAELGQAAVRKAAKRVRDQGRTGEWSFNSEGDLPSSGIFVDFHDKTFRWWSLYGDSSAIPAFGSLWPGWKVETMGDHYEWHEKLLGIQLRSRSDDVEQFREAVKGCFKIRRWELSMVQDEQECQRLAPYASFELEALILSFVDRGGRRLAG